MLRKGRPYRSQGSLILDGSQSHDKKLSQEQESARQGEPVKLKKTVDRYGLGYKPTKQNKKRIAAEKQEKKLARLEGRDPVSPGLGEVPHISATFPKPAYVYQPQPFFFDEDEEEQYSEKVEELLVLAKKSRELKEVFEYYDIPEEAGHFIRAYKLQPSKTVQSLRFTVLFVQPLPEKGSKAVTPNPPTSEEDNPTSSQSIDFIHCQGISFQLLSCFPSRPLGKRMSNQTKELPEDAIS